MTLYKRPGSSKYYVRFSAGGRQHRLCTGTDNRETAKSVGSKLEQDAVLGANGIPKVQPTLFTTMAQAYLDIKQGSRARSLESIVKWWAAYFGAVKVETITTHAIEKALAPFTSNATRNRYLAYLRAMFNQGIRWNMADRNPCSGIRMLYETPRMRWLKKDEINSLLLKTNFPVFFMAAIHTGMRRGELLQLTWNDVDFDNRLITVRRSKNGDSRVIPMTDALSEALYRLHFQDYEAEFVFSATESALRLDFERVCRELCLTDLRIHDLRHTFACQMRLKGVDIQTLQQLLGHRDIKMTLRYANVGPDFVNLARAKMKEAFD